MYCIDYGSIQNKFEERVIKGIMTGNEYSRLLSIELKKLRYTQKEAEKIKAELEYVLERPIQITQVTQEVLNMIEKLNQYMKVNNLNQKQLASLLSVTESHLSRILSGQKKPGAKLIEQYLALPGIREKEIINSIRETVNNLWINGKIQEKEAKEILKTLNGKKDFKNLANMVQ